MPSASKYNIDVANIRPAGRPTKGLYVGSRESHWAQLGNTCIYDKVYYELSMSNVSGIDPAGGTFYASSYADVNRKTHGNGNRENGLPLDGSSITIPANTDASSKSYSMTVTQYDSALGSYVGASVTWGLTQLGDYPTSMTLTLGEPSDIPAAGGCVSSTSYSVTVRFKSGNTKTNPAGVSISWGPQVCAPAMGPDETSRKYIGSLSATASFSQNGHSVSDSASVSVYQEGNKETGEYFYEDFRIVPAEYPVFPANGGTVGQSVTPSATITRCSKLASGDVVRTYNVDVSPSECSWYISTTNSPHFSVNSPSSYNTSASVQPNDLFEGRGTYFDTYATANTSTYKTEGGGSLTDNGRTYTYQEAKGVDIASITLEITSAPTIPANGGTVTINDCTKKVTAHYNNGTTADVTAQCTFSGTTAVTATAGTAAGKVGTIQVTAHYNGLTSNEASIDVMKDARAESGRVVTSLTVNPITYGTLPNSGGTVSPSSNASVNLTYTITYTDGSTGSTTVSNYTGSDISFTISSNQAWATPSNASSNSTSLSVQAGSNRTATITTSATHTGTGVGGSATSTVSQGARAESGRVVTSLTVNPITYGNAGSVGATMAPTTEASVNLVITINYNDGTTGSTTDNNYTGSGITYSITSNQDWASIVSSTSRSTSILVGSNNTTVPRSATITTTATHVSGANGSASSTLTQDAAVVLKTPKVTSIEWTVS